MATSKDQSSNLTRDRSAVEALLDSSIVCDLVLPWIEIGRSDLREATLPRYLNCGFSFVSLTLASDLETQAELFQSIAKQRRYFYDRPDMFRLIETVEDIHASKTDKTLAVSFNLQGTNALAGDLNMVEVFYQLGIRQILLAYNKKNLVGDGCHERTDSGLSDYGVELINEMNRVGMIVDCSHTGYQTSMDAMEVSSAPVIFSHSNPKSLWEHDRNIKDDQALACANTGGLVGVTGVGIFMGNDDASTETFFRQIDYYAELIGPDHIGIGLDYVYDIDAEKQYMAGVNSPVSGNYHNMNSFFTPDQLPELCELMISSGYSDDAIQQILGANYLRIAQQVWR